MSSNQLENLSEISNRKDDHIRINRDENVQSGISAGFDDYSLLHCALPEMDFTELDLSSTFLSKEIKAPILISSMTGGTKEGDEITRRLAISAEKFGIPIGVGSQRIDLQRDVSSTKFRIRDFAPDVPVYANLGAVQLNYGLGIKDCLRAIEMVDADALILHLNPLQEALQPEGQTNFAGLIEKISTICKNMQQPIIIKEVGWGINHEIAKELVDAGVACIDVAGAGGTSWALVEKFRNTDSSRVEMSENFKTWGISTVKCLLDIKKNQPKIPLIASGGVKNGIDIAKSVALGASLCGIAGPLFRAAAISQEKLDSKIGQFIEELRIAMFVTGAKNLKELSKVKIYKNNEH
jgi:isopentenyl-diphosphate delta-isomerase